MSKEPTKRSDEPVPPEPTEEGQYHGYSPAQIARIKRERDATAPPPVVDEHSKGGEDDDKKHK